MLQLRNFDDVLQSCGCLIILMMSHNFEDILRYSKVFYKFVKYIVILKMCTSFLLLDHDRGKT